MSAPSRSPRRNKRVSINLSIHRTITQTCLIVCFIICLSLLISPVESLRKAKRKPIAAHHSEVASSDEVFLNQAISEPVNQSNDQSVELQPANQSPPPTEPLADKVDDVVAKEPTVPQNSLADQVDHSADLLAKEPTKPQYQRSYPADEFFKTPTESNKVDVQSVAEPVQKQRIVEVPTKPVNRARSSIYRSSNQSPKPIRQNQPSEQDVPVATLNARKPRHQHSPDEDIPLGSLDAPKISRHHHSANEEIPIGVIDEKDSSDDQRVDGVVVGAIHSGHSDHEPGKESDDQRVDSVAVGAIHSGHSDPEPGKESDVVSESSLQEDSQSQPSEASPAADQPLRYSECLSDEAAKQIKEKTKTNLLGIMKNYQAIWALEGRSDDDIRQLINKKSRELAGVLKAQKAELAKQLCTPAAASTSSNDQSPEGAVAQSNGIKKRVSLYDRLSKVSGDQSNKADSVQVDGIPADLVPGGIARHLLSFDEISLIETEDDEDEDDRVYVSSIHPYHHEPDAPSAYTELSERDIASRHESVDDQIMNEDDDDFGPGFRATITPTRLTDLEISTLALRTARDIEEEIAEEKRRRIERLKARRGIVIASIMPVADSQSHNDEHQQIGHFVASIKPQHSSPIFEEDLMKEAYKTKSFKPVRAGITAPKKQSNPEEKVEVVPSKSSREWMKSEGSSSRSRLARMIRGE